MTITNSRSATGPSTPPLLTPDASNSHSTGHVATPNGKSSSGSISSVVKADSLPIPATQQGPNSHSTLAHTMPKNGASSGSNSRSASESATPTLLTLDGSTSPAAGVASMPKNQPPQGGKATDGHRGGVTQIEPAAGSNAPDLAALAGATTSGLTLLDPALSLAADILDDLENLRKANENRIRQMTRDVDDKDGERRGAGLSPDNPDVMRIGVLVHHIQQLEHEAVLHLQRKMRKHPLGDWIKGQKGIGLKQGARLLAAIGDPYWRRELVYTDADGNVTRIVPEGPRTVSALWAYCGLHVLSGGQQSDGTPPGSAAGDQHRDTDGGPWEVAVGVAAKRRRGERANWSNTAKMRAHLIAESCIKQISSDCRDGHLFDDSREDNAISANSGSASKSDHGSGEQPLGPRRSCLRCSPYRVVYDLRRAHTAVTHPEWTDGHSHNDGLRVASKEILKDLWRAARDWHHGHPL